MFTNILDKTSMMLEIELLQQYFIRNRVVYGAIILTGTFFIVGFFGWAHARYITATIRGRFLMPYFYSYAIMILLGAALFRTMDTLWDVPFLLQDRYVSFEGTALSDADVPENQIEKKTKFSFLDKDGNQMELEVAMVPLIKKGDPIRGVYYPNSRYGAVIRSTEIEQQGVASITDDNFLSPAKMIRAFSILVSILFFAIVFSDRKKKDANDNKGLNRIVSILFTVSLVTFIALTFLIRPQGSLFARYLWPYLFFVTYGLVVFSATYNKHSDSIKNNDKRFEKSSSSFTYIKNLEERCAQEGILIEKQSYIVRANIVIVATPYILLVMAFLLFLAAPYAAIYLNHYRDAVIIFAIAIATTILAFIIRKMDRTRIIVDNDNQRYIYSTDNKERIFFTKSDIARVVITPDLKATFYRVESNEVIIQINMDMQNLNRWLKDLEGAGVAVERRIKW